MASHKYEIREICGDWALDIHWGKETTQHHLNECDFADGVCPHGNSIQWWLKQPVAKE